MAKKNFTGGLNSLLGDKPGPQKKVTTEGAKKFLNEMAKRIDQPDRAKRGRPVTQTKEITKSSQEGTKANETRATFIVNEELLDNIKAISYWERELIKDTINRALQEAVDKYEKKNGSIKAIPKK